MFNHSGHTFHTILLFEAHLVMMHILEFTLLHYNNVLFIFNPTHVIVCPYLR